MHRFAIVGLLLLVALPRLEAQPKTLAGHDLRIRPVGQATFTPQTPHVGVEVVHDAESKATLYLSEAGHLAVTTYQVPAARTVAESLYAHELRVRTAEEATFTKQTQAFSVEAFRDVLTNRLLYATDSKHVAVSELPTTFPPQGEPVFQYGLTFRVRAANESQWKDAKQYGVEVYKDSYTGRLVYISQTGSIATYPAPTTFDPAKIKGAKSLYGMGLLIRKAAEVTDATTKPNLGVEVFADPNSGAFVYISETGSVAVVAPTTNVQQNQKPLRTHGLRVKCRKGTDRDFMQAVSVGVEVFRDLHTGNMVWASEHGSLAVLRK
jgi:hypothetical protein